MFVVFYELELFSSCNIFLSREKKPTYERLKVIDIQKPEPERNQFTHKKLVIKIGCKHFFEGFEAKRSSHIGPDTLYVCDSIHESYCFSVYFLPHTKFIEITWSRSVSVE